MQSVQLTPEWSMRHAWVEEVPMAFGPEHAVVYFKGDCLVVDAEQATRAVRIPELVLSALRQAHAECRAYRQENGSGAP